MPIDSSLASTSPPSWAAVKALWAQLEAADSLERDRVLSDASIPSALRAEVRALLSASEIEPIDSNQSLTRAPTRDQRRYQGENANSDSPDVWPIASCHLTLMAQLPFQARRSQKRLVRLYPGLVQ